MLNQTSKKMKSRANSKIEINLHCTYAIPPQADGDAINVPFMSIHFWTVTIIHGSDNNKSKQ